MWWSVSRNKTVEFTFAILNCKLILDFRHTCDIRNTVFKVKLIVIVGQCVIELDHWIYVSEPLFYNFKLFAEFLFFTHYTE